MKLPIILTAAAASLILGVVLESASIIAMIGFLATGICAGVLAQSLPRGAERPYWIFVGVILLLLIVSFFGADLSRLWFILPIVFVISYFFARFAQKILRRLSSDLP